MAVQELKMQEVDSVSGGDWGSAAGASVMGFGIGTAAFGASWGAVPVGLAFAVSPLSVVALVGLAGYAGYEMFSE